MRRRSGGHNGGGDGGGGVGLLPFLAVLLCTMGGLLVLLVVMAEQARKSALAEQSVAAEPEPNNELAEDLLRQLEAAEAMLVQAESLFAEAQERLAHEKERLAHSEEHQRRLEKELAELALTAQQLEQTEDDASVDQRQAEAARDRLRDILAETEAQVETLREQGVGEKSYAIVPYTGPNGTQRQPIYVECLAEELIIHPEGVRITSSDLVDPQWPGNPLAAALRASRDLLNRRALQANQPEPPDPYPLLVVRPQGNRMYHLARTAIQSWDSDYGYEFVEQKRKLVYPVEPDGGLAQAQQHAVINARERLASRVNAAPSRYRNHLAAQAAGAGIGSMVDDSPGLADQTGGQGSVPTSDQLTASGVDGAEGGELRYGQLVEKQQEGRTGEGGDGAGSPTGETPDEYLNPNQELAESSVAGPRYDDNRSNAVAGAGGSAPEPPSGAGQMAAVGAAAPTGPPVESSSPQGQSSSQGSGVGAPGRRRRGATPIQRVIRLVVDGEQAVAGPDDEGPDAEGVSVLGTDKEVAERLRSWIHERVEGWGLAGQSLYWKPVVVLDVLPEGQRHAARLTKLIEYHGVEVRVDRTAQRTEASDASRR
ncbi:MAG: hypothetical protein AAGA92_03355 [Planctomycetota bacterium]